ncbi:hypothetical protein BHM03_00026461 [Ensete ventricosum]|nr:hypothetical protein BHM03_00026461 [Ensete ventricosum]
MSSTRPTRSFYPLPLLGYTMAFFHDSRPQLYQFSTPLSYDSLCSILYVTHASCRTSFSCHACTLLLSQAYMVVEVNYRQTFTAIDNIAVSSPPGLHSHRSQHRQTFTVVDNIVVSFLQIHWH